MAPGRERRSHRAKRRRILRVVVSEEEAERIARCAAETGLSVSAYLRQIGLGRRPKQLIDQQLILQLIKISGDQGRLGGLLKLWLADRPGSGASAFDVRKLLRQIEAAQAILRQAIGRL
jgi:hypothetical protein